ncbi:MAG: DNA replication/repair protein RecF [Mycobacterium leprae]
MYLSSLELFSFRNYSHLTCSFSPTLNVIYGDNGQGKTNLLEAVYFLATGRSHRTSRDQDLLKEGESAFGARASVMRSTGEMLLELKYSTESRKQLKINGLPEKKITKLLGNLAAVLFSPDDLQLLKGSPAGRRRFLDVELSQISQTYLHHLSTYNKTLLQRNSILKQNAVDGALLSVYDEQLLDAGAQIIVRRAAAVQRLSAIATEYHAMMSNGVEHLHLAYESQPLGDDGVILDLADVRQRLQRLLTDRRKDEIRRQISLVGPHRDDINITIDDRDARLFASQGQQRTAVLALKLAELRYMAEQLGETPILLLDDVASELDPHRRNFLLNTVGETAQTFITCTDLEDLAARSWSPEHRLFRVKSGYVEWDRKGLP